VPCFRRLEARNSPLGPACEWGSGRAWRQRLNSGTTGRSRRRHPPSHRLRLRRPPPMQQVNPPPRRLPHSMPGLLAALRPKWPTCAACSRRARHLRSARRLQTCRNPHSSAGAEKSMAAGWPLAAPTQHPHPQ
jgi:hypothetical protein